MERERPAWGGALAGAIAEILVIVLTPTAIAGMTFDATQGPTAAGSPRCL